MLAARDEGLVVIEDAAQAIGAEHKRRRRAVDRALRLLLVLSLEESAPRRRRHDRPNDSQRAEQCSACARTGRSRNITQAHWRQFRLDALQRAGGVPKLGHIDDWTLARQRKRPLHRLLNQAGLTAGPDPVVTPSVVTDRHIFNQYVIRVPHRDG